MANLSKLITAAGAAIVAVFSLVGMIVVLAAGQTVYGTYVGPSGGTKVNAIFEFLLLLAISGSLVAGSFGICKYSAKLLPVLAGGAIAMALAAGLPLGFYAVFGGVVALIGCCWDKSCCESVEAGTAGTPATTETPPESKL